MENRVPLPADNVYKFYVLCGLFLTIFSIGAIIYVSQSTNGLVFDVVIEYETLKTDPVRSVVDEAQIALL